MLRSNNLDIISTYSYKNPIQINLQNKLSQQIIAEVPISHLITEDNITSISDDEIQNKINLIKLTDDVDLDVQIQSIDTQSIEQNICIKCKMSYKITDDCLICENCGIEKPNECELSTDNYNLCLESNYNSNSDSYVSFSFKGKGSYGYQKALLIACSDYKAITHKEVSKELLNIIDQYEGYKMPKNIIHLSIDLYFTVKKKAIEYFTAIYGENTTKKKIIFRGKGKLGMYAACLYYACIMENLSRTPKEIANIVGVEEKYMSTADKKLQEFHELGLIDLPINVRLIDDYINRFFPLLGIPLKYKDFIIYLLHRADEKYIHINHESRISTKCIGAIYLLCQRIPELKHITKEIIAQECNISKSTCIKYYTLLMNNWMYLRKAFKKYRIPMPKTWRKI